MQHQLLTDDEVADLQHEVEWLREQVDDLLGRELQRRKLRRAKEQPAPLAESVARLERLTKQEE